MDEIKSYDVIYEEDRGDYGHFYKVVCPNCKTHVLVSDLQKAECDCGIVWELNISATGYKKCEK